MCASLGSAEASSAERSVRRRRWGGRTWRRPFSAAGSAGRDISGTALISKSKGRLRAAEVETTAEDIRSSEDFRERRGIPSEAISLFIRLIKFCSEDWFLSR